MLYKWERSISAEHRASMSAPQTGKSRSAETRAKIGAKISAGHIRKKGSGANME